jgi:uncharacterized damage-inducible protein DinB
MDNAAEIENILSLFSSVFEKNAWYGPSVKEVLNDVRAEHASLRIKNTHSIIELVAHMTSWRTFVIKRLEGDNEFSVTDELNFPAVSDWAQAVRDLYEGHEKLIALLRIFPPVKLFEIVPHASYRYTFYTLLQGIIHHDIYHIGQISLIKKSL